MRLDSAHEALVNQMVLVNLVKRLRNESYSTIEGLAEECEVSRATIIRREHDIITTIYDEVYPYDITGALGEIAERHNLQESDIIRICDYAMEKDYV